MRRLVEAYRGVPPHQLDYTALLRATNRFGAGRDLEWDEDSFTRLQAMLSEAEAWLDLRAAWRSLSEGRAGDPAAMKVSSELEFFTFYEPLGAGRVLYVGSGAYPQSALYALERLPELRIDGIDLVPHCSVLCSALAERLGLSGRLAAFTVPGEELPRDLIASYDGFFLSSAVRPKNAIIERILRYRRPGTPLYAREDEAHPLFYEPVEVDHPEVLSARRARARWSEAKGSPAPLPEGCEVDHVGEGGK
ncbi:MAG: hypothetical protein J2O39_07715 [Acidimicrobiales bacterium]|nr:hypothetical protein [Acidimicrobiales bacterium]